MGGDAEQAEGVRTSKEVMTNHDIMIAIAGFCWIKKACYELSLQLIYCYILTNQDMHMMCETFLGNVEMRAKTMNIILIKSIQ